MNIIGKTVLMALFASLSFGHMAKAFDTPAHKESRSGKPFT